MSIKHTSTRTGRSGRSRARAPGGHAMWITIGLLIAIGVAVLLGYNLAAVLTGLGAAVVVANEAAMRITGATWDRPPSDVQPSDVQRRGDVPPPGAASVTTPPPDARVDGSRGAR